MCRYPFTRVQFTNIAPLILPPEADQCWSEISPLTASKTFTQRRWRIDAGSLHANGSVIGASILINLSVVHFLGLKMISFPHWILHHLVRYLCSFFISSHWFFPDSNNPESYCVYRLFHDNTTFDLDLLMDMPHKAISVDCLLRLLYQQQAGVVLL